MKSRLILNLSVLLSLIVVLTQEYPDLWLRLQKESLLTSEKKQQLTAIQPHFETLNKKQKLLIQPKQLTLLEEQCRMQVRLRNCSMLGLLAVVLITYLIFNRQRKNIRKSNEIWRRNEEIFRAKLENARLQELKLLAELESKNKQLASYSLNFIQKNKLMEELKENIHQLRKLRGQENTKELNGLNRLVENSLQIDKDWEDFKRNFEEVHKDFYRDLKDYYPDLTNNELKLCTLLKLNMNLKEAANIMGISPESVKKARHRLRKKFNLSREENLVDHIISLEKHNRQISNQLQIA